MAIQTKLEHLINRDLFSNYYLENLLPESETWKSVDEDKIKKAFENIKEIFEEHKEYVETYQEDYLQNRFIDPIFEELGFEYGTEESVKKRQRTPDYGLFENDEALKNAYERKEDEDFYKNALTIGEAKRWGRDLDKRGGVRDFTNPSHQVYVYLQETPVDWAILTNGEKWRLYYSETSHKLDSYYEIDLPTLLEREDGLEAFKYFYLLFRSEAFVKDKREKCFLDKVYDKSNLFSQELGEDLKENIYEAIRLLSEGFLEFPENDLDPEDDLNLIHDSSLIYLYRLIFVLYAESEGRDLLNTSNRIYNENYSLNTLKQEVCEKLEENETTYTDWRGKIWDRLEELFVLIDKGSESKGIPREELYIPAYNGGLFRTDITEDTSQEIAFLQNNKVGDSYLVEVIDLLTRHESQNGEGRVFVDYSSLDIRHLGSIYEGLLEYNLNVASKEIVAVKEDKEEKWYIKEEYDGDETIIEELDEGEIYLTTDKGERKATGSYYTPEYVVQYIVENTLDPILDDIREDLLKEGRGNFANRFAERVFELKVLDPAMGSGHFLTNAVDHLAREIVDAHQRQAEEEGAESVDESHDIHWARRQVSQKCIYGVDLNPMAVELAKVSLWLRTLAAQQPLAFLDHHLKTGNSLIGSDIEDIEELDSSGKKEDVGNATLEDFGMTWKGTMEDLMSIYQDFIKIENQELSDIKEMEEKFHEFEHEPIKERLEAMANVHTARDFGIEVPDDAFSSMASAVDDKAKWEEIKEEDWFDEAQKLAGDKEFFHWKLAFPEVFYDEEGEKKENEGFNVVIGNPPYVRIYRGRLDEENVEYWRKKFSSAYMKFDLYVLFLELSIDLANNGGYISMIIPDKFLNAPYGEPIRKKTIEVTSLRSILDLREVEVFEDASVSNVVPISRKGEKRDDSISIKKRIKEDFIKEKSLPIDVIVSTQDKSFRISKDEKDEIIINKIEKRSIELEKICYSNWGLRTGSKEKTEKYVVESSGHPKAHPMIRGDNIEDSYVLRPPSEYIIYDKENLYNPMFEEFFENQKIIFRKITDSGLMAVMDENNYYCFSTLIPCLNINDICHVERTGIPEPTEYSDKYNDLYFILSLVNSKLLGWYYKKEFSDELSVVPKHIQRLPIRKIVFENSSKKRKEKLNEGKELFKEYLSGVENTPLFEFAKNNMKDIEENESIKAETIHDFLGFLAKKMTELNNKKQSYNLNILDYLGNYSKGNKLEGVFSPAEGVSDTILTETATDREKLRLSSIEFLERNNELILKASARYKPEDEEEFTEDELDRWGYTESELIPAMKFTGDEKELALIREFTKLAVEKGGGFANFRESATKTLSILDRLEKLTLPKSSDVENGLEKYLEQKEKVERLEEDIRETDHTIDAIVFDLYDLTEDDVKTVLDSLDTPKHDKEDILNKFRDINK